MKQRALKKMREIIESHSYPCSFLKEQAHEKTIFKSEISTISDN